MQNISSFLSSQLEREEKVKATNRIKTESFLPPPTERPIKNMRAIYDVLYGFIPITEWEEQIINSPFFQRLRWIKQLGFANYIFPGAEHNRFAHVIGVMHSMDQMIRALGLSVPDHELFDPKAKNPAAMFHKSMRIAALLHDIAKPQTKATNILLFDL